MNETNTTRLRRDEVDVLELLAARLTWSRNAYSESGIDADDRDLRTEGANELSDTLVYVRAELLRMRRSR